MGKMSTAAGLICRDVIKVGAKKVVVLRAKHESDTVAVDWYPLISKGSLLGRVSGWTSLAKSSNVEKLGIWRGTSVSPGASGYVESIDGPPGPEGVSNMATKTKKAAKKGGKAAAKKSGSNGGERKRATNEELDEQAAEVVRLRDEEDLSWQEVADKTGIAMGRLRGLYNRGGGEPTRERKGAAKKKAAETAKKNAKKGSKRSRKGADPSDED